MPVLREHLQLKPTEEHLFSDNSNSKQMCLPNLWDFSERVEIPDFQSPAAWLVDFPDTPMIALSQISTQIYLVKGRFQRKKSRKKSGDLPNLPPSTPTATKVAKTLQLAHCA